MTAEEKIKLLAAALSTHQLVEAYDIMASRKEDDMREWHAGSLIRDVLLDELERRNEPAFFEWMSGNDASPARYFLTSGDGFMTENENAAENCVIV